MKFYILEDFYQVADEKSLLHFFNSLREAGVLLLLSAKVSSKKFKIEDLSSHLENIPTVVIEDSSKEVLKSLLLNRLARKEIKASNRLIKLILSEVRKSYATLNEKMKREIS